MLYNILRVLVWTALQGYFRKIYIEGDERIPEGKPVVLAANHQSAFIEPTVIACYQKHPIHFMTRGDVFVKSFMWFFKATHQIPIYRFKDGFGNIRKNKDTFSACYEVLSQNKKILIFAQPGVVWEKRISPVQRGAARMTTGAIELHPELDPYILPVGINFTDHTKMNSIVMAKFGTPIRVKEYLNNPDLPDQRSIEIAIRVDIRRQLDNLIVHIEDKEDDPIVEKLLEMKENNHFFSFLPKVVRDDSLLKEQIGVARAYSESSDKSNLKNEIQEYADKLDETGLKDIGVAKGPVSRFIALVIYFFFSPIGLVSILLNILPYTIAKWVAIKTTKTPEFYSSVKIHLTSFLYYIYFAILLVIGLCVNFKMFLIILFGLPITGVIGLWYYQNWEQNIQIVRFLLLAKKVKKELVYHRNKVNEHI